MSERGQELGWRHLESSFTQGRNQALDDEIVGLLVDVRQRENMRLLPVPAGFHCVLCRKGWQSSGECLGRDGVCSESE